MEQAKRIFRFADRILMIFSLLIAMLIALYSGYVLYDIFYTNQNAFTSYDLLQYKPVSSGDTDTVQVTNGFDGLLAMNPDAVGWVTIDDTNIDYPIVQGKDDLEYASKDIYGNGSITGSIYLSSSNRKDFGDWYNLLYGHHMANGAMFGDLEKYMDEDFFSSHLTGTLQTPDGDYDLKIFACIFTDAYDGMIYGIVDGTLEGRSELIEYIKENAVQLDSDFLTGYYPDKITAFSTCGDASTNGRIVLFADTKPKAQAVINIVDDESVSRKAIGHITESRHWAFLNLICVLLTIFNFLPIFKINKKFRQRKYSKDFIRRIEDYSKIKEENGETVIYLVKKINKNLHNFIKRMNIGTAAELILSVAGIAAFLLTENIRMPMVMSDGWTWLMVLILAVSLISDFVFFRYFGKHPNRIEHLLIETENSEKEETFTV